MKRLLIGLLITTLLLTTAGCGSSGQETITNAGEEQKEVYELKIAHHIAEGTLYDEVAVRFKEKAEEMSNGRIKITVYPGGVLGDERAENESIQYGNLDFGVLTISTLVNFMPELAVFDLPYVFNNDNQIRNFIKSDVAKDLLSVGDEEGYVGLGFVVRGPRYVTSSKGPIKTDEERFQDKSCSEPALC